MLVFEARSPQLRVPATMPADTVTMIPCHGGLQSPSRTASLSQPFLLEGAYIMVFGDSNRKILTQGICPSQPGLGYDLITILNLAMCGCGNSSWWITLSIDPHQTGQAPHFPHTYFQEDWMIQDLRRRQETESEDGLMKEATSPCGTQVANESLKCCKSGKHHSPVEELTRAPVGSQVCKLPFRCSQKCLA